MVKLPTLDFISGHDLAISGFKPHIRLRADSTESAWDSLPLSLFLWPSPVHACSVSKINKLKKIKFNKLFAVRTKRKL